MARASVAAIKECLRIREESLIAKHCVSVEKPQWVLDTEKEMEILNKRRDELSASLWEWRKKEAEQRENIRKQIKQKMNQMLETILLEGDNSGMLQQLQSLDTWKPNL